MQVRARYPHEDLKQAFFGHVTRHDTLPTNWLTDVKGWTGGPVPDLLMLPETGKSIYPCATTPPAMGTSHVANY